MVQFINGLNPLDIKYLIFKSQHFYWSWSSELFLFFLKIACVLIIWQADVMHLDKGFVKGNRDILVSMLRIKWDIETGCGQPIGITMPGERSFYGFSSTSSRHFIPWDRSLTFKKHCKEAAFKSEPSAINQ